MTLDPKICSRARLARDARFDGRFFIGVKTTGIYCRPVCPVTLPKEKNVTYHLTAAAAAEAGFRPCLRCRPEAAPNTAAWVGTSSTVSRGLRLIADGALDHGTVEALAERLGVGGRHLRRLFVQRLGASPLAIAQTRRLHFAKQLIDDTDMSMTEIATGAGYGSVRRFNAAFRATYQRTPSQLRRSRRGNRSAGGRDAITIRLPYRPPLQWDALTEFLATRAIPGVERVADGAYSRTIEINGVAGTIEVRHDVAAAGLVLEVCFAEPSALFAIAERVRRIFDVGADPEQISACFEHDGLLGPAVRLRPGLRVPGAWHGFELAVRAVLGQQISVKGASTLAGRLAQRFGRPLEIASGVGSEGASGSALGVIFPAPAVLADADVAQIGLPRTRAAAVRELARAVSVGRIRFDDTQASDELVAHLKRIPGIGDWTAHYVAMRALGDPDAFPSSDLVLRRAAAAPGDALTPARLAAKAEAWRPWRSYATLHLWTSYSAQPTKAQRRA